MLLIVKMYMQTFNCNFRMVQNAPVTCQLLTLSGHDVSVASSPGPLFIFAKIHHVGRAHSEREDFEKGARRDVIDPFHMKMHF